MIQGLREILEDENALQKWRYGETDDMDAKDQVCVVYNNREFTQNER